MRDKSMKEMKKCKKEVKMQKQLFSFTVLTYTCTTKPDDGIF